MAEIVGEEGALPKLSPAVARLVQESLAASTRSAYLSDLQHFERWGGSTPASPEEVATYLADYADVLTVATLLRRLAAVSKAHDAKGFANPTKAELVRATVRGIKRTYGTAQKEAAPLVREDLFAVLDKMGDRPKDRRDRALLLIGFAGGFRRSELVALNRADIEVVRQGLVITVRRSKTDQEGACRKVAVPLGRTRYCAVRALEDWLELAAIEDGPVFRRINRHHHIAVARLSGEAVSMVVKERLTQAAMNASTYSGHSLRAGFVTSAAQAGIASWQIRKQTGHASDVVLARYIRAGEIFENNAVASLL